MYALDGQPKTVKEAVDRMQFFQHSRHGRLPKPMRDVVRTFAQEEALPGLGDARSFREIQDFQSRMRELEKALHVCMCSLTRQGVLHPQSRGRGQESPRLLQMRRSRSLPVELPRRPQRNRGPSPQIKGADEQRSGTGDQKRCGCSPQSMLSQQQSHRIQGSLPLAVWIASPTSPDFGLRGHLSF